MEPQTTGVMIRFKTQTGRGPDLADHLAGLVPAVENEVGTELWVVSRDPVHPDIVWLFESYRDETSKATYERTDAYSKASEITKSMLAGPPEVFPLLPIAGKGLKASSQAKQPLFGYTVIWVEDVKKTVAFYEKAFALKSRGIKSFGSTLWGEVETNSKTTLAFASQNEADTLFADGYHANNAHSAPAAILISLIVPDVQEIWSRALAAGATGRDAPKTEPWGQTVARLRDLNGVLVSLASPPAA